MNAELAAGAADLHSWICERQTAKPNIRARQHPTLPKSLHGGDPVDMGYALAVSYLKIASHIAYEIAFAFSSLPSSKGSLILARSSVEGSANAHHLARAFRSGEEGFLTEVLRERIWMARSSGKTVPGGESEFLRDLLRYVSDEKLIPQRAAESDTKFANRVSSGRDMTNRIEALYPVAPNQGFHYGLLSGYAHVSPSAYFAGFDGDEFTIAFGAAMTALRESTTELCDAFGLNLDPDRFGFWFS
ncbi:MAG: hypothetical protein GY701_17570 [Sulfitobacter sp.]|nr:hypothetical protein [Sulfitobacter sp.]